MTDVFNPWIQTLLTPGTDLDAGLEPARRCRRARTTDIQNNGRQKQFTGKTVVSINLFSVRNDGQPWTEGIDELERK
jgi:hypothetical protein